LAAGQFTKRDWVREVHAPCVKFSRTKAVRDQAFPAFGRKSATNRVGIGIAL